MICTVLWFQNHICVSSHRFICSSKLSTYLQRYLSNSNTPSWWLNQPVWNIWSSNWIISPGIGMKINKLWVATTQTLKSFISLTWNFASLRWCQTTLWKVMFAKQQSIHLPVNYSHSLVWIEVNRILSSRSIDSVIHYHSKHQQFHSRCLIIHL